MFCSLRCPRRPVRGLRQARGRPPAGPRPPRPRPAPRPGPAPGAGDGQQLRHQRRHLPVLGLVIAEAKALSMQSLWIIYFYIFYVRNRPIHNSILINSKAKWVVEIIIAPSQLFGTRGLLLIFSSFIQTCDDKSLTIWKYLFDHHLN